MLDITDQTFEEEVLKSDTPVLVDFWAEWCAPCRIIGPVVDELAKDYKGKLKVGKVNVDDSSGVASRFGVMSIPTLMFFKNGSPVKTMIGAQGKESLKREIEQIIAS